MSVRAASAVSPCLLRTPPQMLRETLPEGVVEAEYEVLNILEFNSTRKRMSVVLRAPDNRILLYCKVCVLPDGAHLKAQHAP